MKHTYIIKFAQRQDIAAGTQEVVLVSDMRIENLIEHWAEFLASGDFDPVHLSVTQVVLPK